MSWAIIPAIFLLICILPAIIMCIMASKQYDDFEQNGIYASAIVISNKRRKRDRNTEVDDRFETIVKYKRNDGKEYESKLWVGIDVPVGTEIKILYKEDNLKTVFAISNDNQTY